MRRKYERGDAETGSREAELRKYVQRELRKKMGTDERGDRCAKEGEGEESRKESLLG